MRCSKVGRSTRQRRVILKALMGVTSHPTAQEVYEMARQELPRLSLGTVYRNLDVLTQRGEIRRLANGGDQARYDGNAAPHHHVRCVECGSVFDAHEVSVPELDAVREVAGCRVIGYNLEFVGRCASCAARPVESECECA